MKYAAAPVPDSPAPVRPAGDLVRVVCRYRPGSAQRHERALDHHVSATYCGGYAIGDGVFIQPEAPLSLPDPVPPEAVLFAGQAADVSLQNGILRVAPSPLLAQSMVCMQGDRPFTIELLPSLGMTNPDAGTYTVDVWKSSTGGPVQLPIVVGASP